MNLNSRKVNTKGFTLVEMLTVVAVIALLAAIAMPNYMQVVKRGRVPEAVATMSIIRQGLRDYYINNGTYFSFASGNIGQAPPNGVAYTVGIAHYFSESAYSAVHVSPAWAGAGISPAPVDFVITADGSASVQCGVSNCAMNQSTVNDFRVQMDNTGRVFVSYDAGANWVAY